MEANTRNRTLALAALFQCVDGVMQIARTGNVDDALLKSCFNSLLSDNVDKLEELYGGMSELRVGLRALMNQLGGNTHIINGQSKDLDATRYSINLLYLEKKLDENPEIFQRLMDGISEAQKQLAFFDMTHPNMAARLAELYTQTISKLGPRIIIKGEQSFLSSPENAAKIRVMLLAGIRAALLWRQSGGNRWKLLLNRGAMQKEAQQLLRGTSATEEVE